MVYFIPTSEALPSSDPGFFEIFRAFWKTPAAIERPALRGTLFQMLFAQGGESDQETMRSSFDRGAFLRRFWMRLGSEWVK
jgi:hypothetical protein